MIKYKNLENDYSHELQTCDWPRNVGCGAEATATQSDNQENALALARSSDRQRHPSAQPQRATPSIFNQRHQVQDQQVNEQLVKQQQLYEEEDFRAIEDDSDRQQRVYRGQPSTLGQVARDRDGISKHRNIIPVTNQNKPPLINLLITFYRFKDMVNNYTCIFIF